MKHKLVSIALGMLLAGPAWTATKSITLQVPGMTCPTCPITIKKTLLKQPGVSAVNVMYAKRELAVKFDDAKTTPAAIMKATASIGFPSQLAK
ncbi:MAG TPA: mercury resistance system periplasmic binding protein MerP [Acidobacteriaceae bacterium]|nr:mercury resistance system periplasmic binding protein MerP [Acidobacteriaceae bacterium]